MKYLILLILGIWANALYSQPTMTTVINPPGTNPNQYKYDILLYPKPLLAAGAKDSQFYHIFTTYGNGDYSPKMTRTKLVNNVTVTKFCWENYDFPGQTKKDTSFLFDYPYNSNNLTYTPAALIASRKGDPPPPPPGAPSFSGDLTSNSITPALVNPGGTRINTVPANKKIHLAHSLGYLKDHAGFNRSAFIISYKPDNCLDNGGSIYLFYGCKRTQNNPAVYAPSAHIQLPANPVPLQPQYFFGQSPVPISDFLLPAGNVFTNYTRFDLSSGYISGVTGAIGPNNDHRIFREIAFQNPVANPIATSDWSYVMAVYASNTTCNCPLPLNDKANLEILGGDIYNKATCKIYNQFVLDVDTMYLKGDDPHDPNRLYITNICNDEAVHLKLEYCNTPPSTVAADQSVVSFQILEPDKFSWCAVKSIECPNGVPVTWTSCQPFCTSQPIQDAARYDCSDHSIYINKKLDLYGCATIDVVLTAHPGQLGMSLKQYLSNHPVLQATIQLLPGGNILRVKNVTIDQMKAEGDDAYPPIVDCNEVAVTPCEPFCFTIPKIVGLAVGLVAAALALYYVSRFVIKRI